MVRTLKNLKFLKIPSVGLFLGPNGSFWRVFQLLGLAAFRGKITSRFEKYTFYIGGTLSQIFFSRKIEKKSDFSGPRNGFNATYIASNGIQTLYFVFLSRFSLILMKNYQKAEFRRKKFDHFVPRKCPCASLWKTDM